MTSQGSASGRFTRAIGQRNLFAAELALREMSNPSLLVALDYVILLAELQPAKANASALRWHGRLELEAPTLTLEESAFALAALVALCAGAGTRSACSDGCCGRCGRRSFRGVVRSGEPATGRELQRPLAACLSPVPTRTPRK
jgi:hypothetical protein